MVWRQKLNKGQRGVCSYSETAVNGCPIKKAHPQTRAKLFVTANKQPPAFHIIDLLIDITQRVIERWLTAAAGPGAISFDHTDAAALLLSAGDAPASAAGPLRCPPARANTSALVAGPRELFYTSGG